MRLFLVSVCNFVSLHSRHWVAADEPSAPVASLLISSRGSAYTLAPQGFSVGSPSPVEWFSTVTASSCLFFSTDSVCVVWIFEVYLAALPRTDSSLLLLLPLSLNSCLGGWNLLCALDLWTFNKPFYISNENIVPSLWTPRRVPLLSPNQINLYRDS